MSTFKTKINKEAVEKFVKENFSKSAKSFETILDGEGSQAFFFSANAKDYVIRVNKNSKGFKKDEYAYKHFLSTDIPIPKTVLLGQTDDKLHFSITERAGGKLLNKLDKNEIHATMPSIIKTLDAIHAVDISKTEGFGYLDDQGNGIFDSHKEALLETITDVTQDSKKVLDCKFLEKKVIEDLLGKYKLLIDYCPEERFLIHQDFGSNNATAENNQITGVFDWELVSYGDFLYDVAWLDFWAEDFEYKEIFRKHYENESIEISNFDKRILCYQLELGIGALMFYAKSCQEEKYKYAKAKLSRRLEVAG